MTTKTLRTAAGMLAAATLSALLIACDTSASEPRDLSDMASSAAGSSLSVKSDSPSDGTVITIRDLQLKTMNEAEAILASGTWQPRVLPSRAFKDAKRSRDTPEQKSQWIVVNVCFPVGEPRDVLVTTFPPSELSPEMRRNIQDGRPPYRYPAGKCVEGKDSINLSHPPA